MSSSRRKVLLTGLAATGLALSPLAALAQDVVKIGYSGPLSGGAAFYGKNVLNGMLLAIDEINATGLDVAGKKVSLAITALDDAYNPSETAINAQRLVQEDKVPAILVPHSGGIFAVQTRNQQQNLLLLAYSSLPEITGRGNKLTIRIPPSIDQYMPAYTNFGMKNFGKKAAIAVTDSDYGKNWEKTFRPFWEKAGGTIVINNPLSYNKSADFYSGVSRVLAAKPDVMVIGGPSEPTGLVIKQARELGYKGGFMLIDQAKMDEVAEITGGYALLNGTIGVLPIAIDTSPVTQAYVERFRKKFPDTKVVSTDTAGPYIGVYALAGAMKLAGTTSDATALRAQMNESFKQLPASVNMLNYQGVDANGGGLYDFRLGVVQDGKVHEVSLSDLSKA